jgi:CHAT domain-containing protein/tetratricopeptide (TPR) repeat protein
MKLKLKVLTEFLIYFFSISAFFLILLVKTVSNIYCQNPDKRSPNEILFHANSCFERQQYDSAALLYRTFLPTTISYLNRNNTNNREIKNTVARVIMQIANICTLKEEYQDAEYWYFKAIKLIDSLSNLEAEIYQNLGSLYFLKEHYEYAILYYQKSWNTYLKDPGKNSGRITDLLTSLGMAYSRKSELIKSYLSFQKADAILRISEKNESLKRAGLNVNIGEILVRLDAPEKALYSYRSAHDLAPGASFSPTNIRLSATKGMAECYSLLGHTDSAMIWLGDCFKLISTTGSDIKHDSSRIFLLMGDVEMRHKAWEKSITYYHKALKMILSDPLDMNTLDPELSKPKADLLDLYKIYEHMGECRLQSAIQINFDTVSLSLSYSDFMIALKISDQIGKEFKQESSRMIFREKTKSILAGTLESGFLLKGKKGNNEFDDLFLLADENKNKLLLEDMEENRFMSLSGISDSLKRKIKAIKDEIVFYSRNNHKKESSPWISAISGVNETEDKVINLRLKFDSLRKETGLYSPDNSLQKYHLQRSYSAGIMNSLKDDEAMLEYFCYDSILFIFLIRNEGLSMERVALPSSFHDSLKACLHKIKCAEVQNFSTLSHQLYTYLIAPVENRLKKIRSLIIIPDEKLSLFPFETLISNDPNECSGMSSSTWHYLVRDFKISYHFSAEAWFKDTLNKGLETKSYRFAGFAPRFSSTPNKLFSANPLPFALKEVKSIAGLFNPVSMHQLVFLDTSATEKNFRLHAPSTTHIHIATHSILSDGDPMNSALIFSESDQPGEHQGMNDGLLYLDEINNLHLNASLVVLSACGTGVGKITHTEGVFAFTRGFYLAGASNVVYSLWNIPDHLTGDFMLNFYRTYFSGESYGDALRKVKLEMITKPETSLPYLWAGIVLLGRD